MIIAVPVEEPLTMQKNKHYMKSYRTYVGKKMEE